MDDNLEIQELKLIKQGIRQYRKQRREAIITIDKLKQAIAGLEISLMKCWDDKQKARLRCKMTTALSRLDTAQARESRLTRYINGLKRELIRLKSLQGRLVCK
jgi:septal ring factor EnvC (AmiA/AmiB activator)